MNNTKVRDTVVNVDGGLELLQACGFELVFEESTPEPQKQTSSPPQPSSYLTAQSSQSALQTESSTTGYLWFPEEAELWLLEAALQLLQPLVSLPFAKAASQSVPQTSTSGAIANICGRETATWHHSSRYSWPSTTLTVSC